LRICVFHFDGAFLHKGQIWPGQSRRKQFRHFMEVA
jgi:hypothetical protein